MSDWQPIETFDSMQAKERPKHAAFYFKPEPGRSRGDYGLGPTVQCERRYGHRVCTHWIPLPEPPKP